MQFIGVCGLRVLQVPIARRQPHDAFACKQAPAADSTACCSTPRQKATPPLRQSAKNHKTDYPAQQDSSLTSLLNVWAQSFSPSTMVK